MVWYLTHPPRDYPSSFYIHASGEATFDDSGKLADQEITVTGANNLIYTITFGDTTSFMVKERFFELLCHPIDYWAAPQKPEPNSLRAAVVAIGSLWDQNDIETMGEVTDEPEIYDPNVVY